jgi:hypothetical protein
MALLFWTSSMSEFIKISTFGKWFYFYLRLKNVVKKTYSVGPLGGATPGVNSRLQDLCFLPLQITAG